MQSEYTSALNELTALRKTHSDTLASHCKYLHTLLASVNTSRAKNGSSKDVTVDSDLICNPDHSKWEKLAGCVTTSVLALTEASKRTKKEVKLLKATNNSLVATLQSADALYKESSEKLTIDMESHEKQWIEKTNKLRAQYDTKLMQVEERLLEFEKKTAELNHEIEICVEEKAYYKTMLEKSEQKIKELDNLLQEKTLALSLSDQQLNQSLNREKECSARAQQLESQVGQMLEVHRGYKNDRACLLACSCLLAGSLYPALARVHELSEQRKILLKQLTLRERLHQQVSQIVGSIQSEIGEHQNKSGNSQCLKTNGLSVPTISPLLQFRKFSIVVLAINRLKKVHKRTSRLFSVDVAFPSSVRHHVSIHMGQQVSKQSRLSQQQHKRQSTDIANWLRSERVLSDIRDSFTGLQSSLDAITSKQSNPRGQSTSSLRTSNQRRVIINPTKDCFIQLLEKMSSRFQPACENYVSNDSLCYRLSRGLEQALRRKTARQYYCSSAKVRYV